MTIIGEWVTMRLFGCHDYFLNHKKLFYIGLFVSMVTMQQRAKQAAKQKPQ